MLICAWSTYIPKEFGDTGRGRIFPILRVLICLRGGSSEHTGFGNFRQKLLSLVYLSAGAAITKYHNHKLDGLGNRNFLTVLEAGSSRLSGQQIRFPMRSLSLAFRWRFL